MTGQEHNRLDVLERRLFGADGDGGLAGDVAEIKRELAEWRGALRFIKAASSLVGLGGAAILLRALVAS